MYNSGFGKADFALQDCSTSSRVASVYSRAIEEHATLTCFEWTVDGHFTCVRAKPYQSGKTLHIESAENSTPLGSIFKVESYLKTTSETKLNLPLHMCMYQFLDLQLFWIPERCQWSEQTILSASFTIILAKSTVLCSYAACIICPNLCWHNSPRPRPFCSVGLLGSKLFPEVISAMLSRYVTLTTPTN